MEIYDYASMKKTAGRNAWSHLQSGACELKHGLNSSKGNCNNNSDHDDNDEDDHKKDDNDNWNNIIYIKTKGRTTSRLIGVIFDGDIGKGLEQGPITKATLTIQATWNQRHVYIDELGWWANIIIVQQLVIRRNISFFFCLHCDHSYTFVFKCSRERYE